MVQGGRFRSKKLLTRVFSCSLFEVVVMIVVVGSCFFCGIKRGTIKPLLSLSAL